MLGRHFEVRVHRGPQLVDEEELAEFIGPADGAVTLLANPITPRVLEACPALKVVGNVAVGFDNVDLVAAEERGVWITNTPDVLTEATADLAWALILAVTRRVVEGDEYVRQGRFQGWALDFMLGSGLQERTLGVVGFGRIGRAVARRGVAFGMKLVYNDIVEQEDTDPPARFEQLEELLKVSHVVSIHAPLTADTYHLLDERRLSLMPPGSYLINTSRGPLVDEDALVRALSGGHLGGAGLDVYEHEPVVHPALVNRSDVVLLPHVGSATAETRAAMAELAVRNVVAVLEGREPPTPVVRGATE
jgi:glyoxylate reductase